MRIADHLSKEQKQQLNKMRSSPKKKSRKKEEHLSQKDWEVLMGMNRDTYKRVNGAVRRK
ncbi:hypothetical protein SAMN05444673_2572 [Bacillus sp. OV166]|uniref:hypothetical protein n=1 Tax=Bacillus sp. OV166 TaxID=1882763 RepID=UPI000A2AD548|nr:hypothetical protein [Bacillus sp. OV166]SMQ75930.1 hypothetical protein SAMN05444673_2572 [Bacillus sp. OV166]